MDEDAAHGQVLAGIFADEDAAAAGAVAPASVAENGRVLAGILADEDTLAELQVILSRATHGTVASPVEAFRESLPPPEPKLEPAPPADYEVKAFRESLGPPQSAPPAHDESNAKGNAKGNVKSKTKGRPKSEVKSEVKSSPLLAGFGVAPPPPPPPAQALDLARQQIKLARTMPCQRADADTQAAIRTLALSLGAVRTEVSRAAA